MEDICHYTSQTLDTTKITIEGVGGHPAGSPATVTVTGAWTINVFATKADGTPDTNGVTVCSSRIVGGMCDAGSPNNYVTIQPLGTHGFYSGETSNSEHHYHDASCGGCENMKQIQIIMTGSAPATYVCIRSPGCKISIGPPS